MRTASSNRVGEDWSPSAEEKSAIRNHMMGRESYSQHFRRNPVNMFDCFRAIRLCVPMTIRLFNPTSFLFGDIRSCMAPVPCCGAPEWPGSNTTLDACSAVPLPPNFPRRFVRLIRSTSISRHPNVSASRINGACAMSFNHRKRQRLTSIRIILVCILDALAHLP